MLRFVGNGDQEKFTQKMSNNEMNLDDDNDRRGVKHKSKEGSEMKTGRIK